MGKRIVIRSWVRWTSGPSSRSQAALWAVEHKLADPAG
jgi:hypothetical protein